MHSQEIPVATKAAKSVQVKDDLAQDDWDKGEQQKGGKVDWDI